MQKKKSLLRAACVLCVAVLLFCSMPPAPVYAETAAERYVRLKGELEDINDQIDSYKGNKAAAQQLRDALVAQKETLDAMIVAKKQAIADTETALAAKAQEVADKRQVIYENDQLFQQRLVAIYKQMDTGTLAMLMAVDSYSEFVTVLDSLNRISTHDTELLEMLVGQRIALEEEQAEIDAMLVTLNQDYADLEADAAALAENIAAQNNNISAYDAQIAAQEQAYDDTYDAMVAAQKEMAAIQQNNANKGSSSSDGSLYVGGQFQWPVPGFYTITCHFGSPDPNGRAHRGMDISGSGVHGATIYACGAGTVITSTSASSYGNYIVIDHGAGVQSLYAHCSALYVGAGAYVEAGTPIAAVGSTGFSTGAHLHLEVQVDGQLQNPLNYLTA